MMLDIHPGDIAHMRKPHPCGSDRWQITRIGTDIGLRCLGCGRRVLLARSVFNKRVKRIIAPDAPSTEVSPTKEQPSS
ncbi:MAG: DUF951 domain-containing protein [Armatimonadetes bacterium]|nr:DUF951 domain-containing protein [Anaerolineae bacterium]